MLAVLKLFSRLGVKRFESFYLKLKNVVFWNLLIMLVMESYLEMHLSSTINIVNLLFSSNSGDWLAAVTSILVAIILNVFPFALFYFLHRNFSRVSEESFKARFSAAYEGLNTEDKAFLFQPLFFLLRRMLFSLIVVLAQDTTIVQIIFLFYIQTAILIY